MAATLLLLLPYFREDALEEDDDANGVKGPDKDDCPGRPAPAPALGKITHW